MAHDAMDVVTLSHRARVRVTHDGTLASLNGGATGASSTSKFPRVDSLIVVSFVVVVARSVPRCGRLRGGESARDDRASRTADPPALARARSSTGRPMIIMNSRRRRFRVTSAVEGRRGWTRPWMPFPPVGYPRASPGASGDPRCFPGRTPPARVAFAPPNPAPPPTLVVVARAVIAVCDDRETSRSSRACVGAR